MSSSTGTERDTPSQTNAGIFLNRSIGIAISAPDMCRELQVVRHADLSFVLKSATNHLQ